MNPRKRGAVTALVFAVCCSAGLALTACQDAPSHPHAPDRDWADAAVTGVQLQAELTPLIRGAATQQLALPAQETPAFVRPYDRGRLSGALRARGGGRPQIAVRHYRDSSGRVHSLGIRYDRAGSPAKRLYLFENGRVRAVVTPAYGRIDGRLHQVGGRYTLFGADGRPTTQVDVRPRRGAVETAVQPTRGEWKLPAVLRDAVALALPRPLHASEIDGACSSEWAVYAATSFAVAALGVALAAEASACFHGNAAACGLIDETATKLATAIAAWTLALDRLAACLERAKGSRSNPYYDGASGGGGGGDGSAGEGGMTTDELRRLVEEFITQSVTDGDFYCSDNGDSCVFY